MRTERHRHSLGAMSHLENAFAQHRLDDLIETSFGDPPDKDSRAHVCK